MALITCADCDKRISDQAASCPHCGRPVESAANSMRVGTEKAIELTGKRLKLISLCSLGAILLGFFLAFMGAKASDQMIQAWGGFLLIGGAVSYIINRVRIYWHHK